jgi:uncharacterized protein (DUF58 family)
VSPEGSDRRPLLRRTVSAIATGLVAGVCVVFVIRAVFGPAVVVVGAAVGLVATLAGALVSWGVFARRSARSDPRRSPGGIRLRARLHPVAWPAPVLGSVVAVLAWAGVAHSSGSGWVQAVGALLAAVLVIGLLAPIIPARSAGLTCTASPSDGQAGRPVPVTMEASGPIRIRPRQPVGPVARAAGPFRGPRTVEVEFVPARRGVIGEVAVEVASCAPFGLLWWGREIRVPLPRPLHVAPRLGQPGPLPSLPESSIGDAPLRFPSGAGEPRGVRPYRPGDTRRSIHWPATSHVGALMVREKERQTDDPVVVDLTLPPDPVAAEAESERVMAALAQILVRGRPVVLGTVEADGHVVRVVRDQIDLGRRLARAVGSPSAGSPSAGSPGPPPTVDAVRRRGPT